uniref:Uncharacterized protein n=1 Tax=Plectus sambesii TaxID=2011161 RepID=A0A914US76_9BILA
MSVAHPGAFGRNPASPPSVPLPLRLHDNCAVQPRWPSPLVTFKVNAPVCCCWTHKKEREAVPETHLRSGGAEVMRAGVISHETATPEDTGAGRTACLLWLVEGGIAREGRWPLFRRCPSPTRRAVISRRLRCAAPSVVDVDCPSRAHLNRCNGDDLTSLLGVDEMRCYSEQISSPNSQSCLLRARSLDSCCSDSAALLNHERQRQRQHARRPEGGAAVRLCGGACTDAVEWRTAHVGG